MGVDQVALLDHASDLGGFGEAGACPWKEIAWELQMPRICSGSAGADLSGARCLEEPEMRPEGSDPEDGDKEVELDLDDEPKALC